MPRPRVERQVDALFESGIDIQSTNRVTIFAPLPTPTLVTALHATLGQIGAEPVMTGQKDR